MKNFFLTTLLLTFFTLPLFVFAQTEYTLLEPSVYNGTYNTTGGKPFSDYLNLVFKIGIGVAAGLAVIQIVIGGIQYMASESPFKIGDAKSKIEGAILGLILALGIYVFLYTINPDIVSLKLDIIQPPTGAPVSTTSITTNGSAGSPKIQECLSCISIPPALDVKVGACSALGLPSKTCKANQGIIETLLLLKNQSSVRNVGWQITEAYPPTYPHKSACHNDGTCVDLNFLAGWFTGVNRSAESINKFCLAAKEVGLKPFYEVKTTEERDLLMKGGATCVRAVSGISAAHFHMER
jgi:hypothetical protein